MAHASLCRGYLAQVVLQTRSMQRNFEDFRRESLGMLEASYAQEQAQRALAETLQRTLAETRIRTPHRAAHIISQAYKRDDIPG